VERGSAGVPGRAFLANGSPAGRPPSFALDHGLELVGVELARAHDKTLEAV
jgi:hypothetical protein